MADITPITLVEIDQDFCTLTYGEGACQASLGVGTNDTGPHKCFNTYSTCQDRANFDKGVKTLRFQFPHSDYPQAAAGDAIPVTFPCLKRVTTQPTRLNPAGADTDYKALGRRASVRIIMQDFVYHDFYVDPYRDERINGDAQANSVGYDPATRSTFWAKWKARNTFYINRPLRVYEGHFGQAIEDMTRRDYFIDRVEGPNKNEEVTIIAKDILKFIDDDRAVVPRPSKGRLAADLAEDENDSFTLEPAGVGEDYGQVNPNRFFVLINEELFLCEPNGDVLNIVSRGGRGTERKDHEAGDRVQECFSADGDNIVYLMRVLLTDYGDVPRDYIDFNEWESERQAWLSGYNLSTVLGEPMGVASAVGQLVQFGPYLWWDERTRKIRLRAIRPNFTENIPANKIIKDDDIMPYPIRKEFSDQQLTQLFIYFGIKEWTGSDSDPENFANLQVHADLEAETENEYNTHHLKTIYSRWLDSGDQGIALSVAQNLVARARDLPFEIKIEVDASRRKDFWTGDLVWLESRIDVDPQGQPFEAQYNQYQIISAEEKKFGETIELVLRVSDYRDIGGSASTRYAFIEPNNAPDFEDATEAQLEDDSGYISRYQATNEEIIGSMSDGSSGWVII